MVSVVGVTDLAMVVEIRSQVRPRRPRYGVPCVELANIDLGTNGVPTYHTNGPLAPATALGLPQDPAESHVAQWL